MAQLHTLPTKIRDDVARAVSILLPSALGRDGSPADLRSEVTSLHEALPVWRLTLKQLNRMRTRRKAGDLQNYIEPTGVWLHQVHKGGKPVGYAHGHRTNGRRHKVVSVAISKEAEAIAQAIKEIDRANYGDHYRAAILECPAVALAGIILFSRRKREAPVVCLFRDPEAAPGSAPAPPVAADRLMERIVKMHIVRGPQSTRRARKRRRVAVARPRRAGRRR